MASKDDDILEESQERLKLATNAENHNRITALEDIRFARLGEQWPEQVRAERERDGRPCLTINRLPAFCRQVVNDARQNKPGIQIRAAGDLADVHTADIFSGLVRNIESSTNADVAYDTAMESAVYGGWGYFRIDVDYGYNDSFDLDIMFKRVANPFTVYADHKSDGADSADWNYAFVTEMVSREAFEKQYPDAESVDFESDGRDNSMAWSSEDEIRVAEYWTRDPSKKLIVKLNSGAIIPAEQYLKEKALFDQAGIQVVGEREVKSYKVKHRLLTGAEVLEDTEWAGCYIPIVPVYGDEVNVEGKRYFRSLIADAKDPQNMLNYWRSAATELVALAPKIPFIGPRGSFATDAEKWNTANRAAHSYIEYDGAVPPVRQPLDSGAAAGALQEATNASQDMRDIMGLHEASMGMKGNETSGVAIRNRRTEGDTSTFHFVDNLSRAVRHGGRILIDLIPKIYTGDRIIRVLGEDGKSQSVQLGQPTKWKGIEKTFDLSVGKYDLNVTAGPNYSTRREEAAMQQIEFMRAVPAMAPMMTDILAQNLDWPQADKLVERIEAERNKPQPPPIELQKIEAQGKVDMQLAQIKAQADGQGHMAKAQSDGQAHQLKSQAEIHKFQAEAQLESEAKQRDSEIEIHKFQAEATLKMEADREAAGNQLVIEQAKIASAEKIAAADIQARQNEKLLELAAGIIAARETAANAAATAAAKPVPKGSKAPAKAAPAANLADGTSFDQHAQAIHSKQQVVDVMASVDELAAVFARE